jgi:FtsZ-interacting cell division protein ZipA
MDITEIIIAVISGIVAIIAAVVGGVTWRKRRISTKNVSKNQVTIHGNARDVNIGNQKIKIEDTHKDKE